MSCSIKVPPPLSSLPYSWCASASQHEPFSIFVHLLHHQEHLNLIKRGPRPLQVTQQRNERHVMRELRPARSRHARNAISRIARTSTRITRCVCKRQRSTRGSALPARTHLKRRGSACTTDQSCHQGDGSRSASTGARLRAAMSRSSDSTAMRSPVRACLCRTQCARCS